jgi:hypothetical protein
VVGCCDNDNEPSGFIKLAEDVLAFQEGLCAISVELVRIYFTYSASSDELQVAYKC